MQFKTSRGILNIPGEWEGVVCFEKQVEGDKWYDDILNDKGSGDKPKIGCYYYNGTASKNLPGGTNDPFYHALVKNTNGTRAGLRPFALDQNTLYISKSNMLAYIHKSSGLAQVKVESSNKSTNATNATNAGIVKTFKSLSSAFTFGHIITEETNALRTRAVVTPPVISGTEKITTYNPYIGTDKWMFDSTITFRTASGDNAWRTGTYKVTQFGEAAPMVEDNTEYLTAKVWGSMYDLGEVVTTNIRITTQRPVNGVMRIDVNQLYQELFETTKTKVYVLSAQVSPTADQIGTPSTPLANCQWSGDYQYVWIGFPSDSSYTFFIQITAHKTKFW